MSAIEFWERVFIASIGAGKWVSIATENADLALKEWEKRFEEAEDTE